jgi:TRAP-type transport system periplasmic protein
MVNHRKPTFHILIVALLLIAILVLSACSQSTAPSSTAAPAPAKASSAAPVAPASTAPAAAATAAAAPSAAIVLTFATTQAENNTFSVTGKKWMEYVEKETGGKVKFKPYWGGTLISGTEGLSEIAKGVADCGWAANFQTKGTEITNGMAQFISAAPTGKMASKVSLDIFNVFPAWAQESGNDLKIFGFMAGESKYIMSTRAINSLADLRGMTLAADNASTPVLKEFGAAGQMMPTAETYVSVQKGILDAVMFSTDTCKTLKFHEVCKYLNNDLYTATPSRPIEYFNRKAYDKLPPDVQKVIENSINYLIDVRVAAFADTAKEGADIAKNAGVKFNNLSAEDKAKWAGVWQKVGSETAKNIDALGKPGTPIMTKCQELIKKYSQ